MFDLRAGGEEPEGFPAGTKRHAYPIVEGVEGQDESVRNAIAAVKEAVEQDKKYFSIVLVDVIVQVQLLRAYC